MSLLSFRTVLRRAGSRSHFLGEPATDRDVSERERSLPRPKGKTAGNGNGNHSPKIIGCESGMPSLARLVSEILTQSVANMEHQSQHHLHHEHGHQAHMWLEGDAEQHYTQYV